MLEIVARVGLVLLTLLALLALVVNLALIHAAHRHRLARQAELEPPAAPRERGTPVWWVADDELL